MQAPKSLTSYMFRDPAEAITSCYLQVLFWPERVALTTKENHGSECNQEGNTFVGNFSPVVYES